jgi:outer membrane receptor protein involved in Fe transport
LFQKSITQPIEQVAPNRETVTYRNSPDAEVQGVEAEWRMNLDLVSQSLNEFTIGANAAYIQSTVPLTPAERINRSLFGDTATSRPLYDQPQYLFNGDLTWERKSWGTMLNLSAGLVGRRLVVAGVRTPDEFEEPAPQLDVTFSQKLGRHWRLKFSARNLLDPPFEKIQEHPSLGPVTIASYTKGMTFGVSLGCEF